MDTSSDGKIVRVGNGTVSATQLRDGVLNMIRAQHHLIDVDSELAAIIGWMPGIVGRLDMNYKYLFLSPQIEELSGNPASYYIGKSHEDLETDYILKVRWQNVLEFVTRTRLTKELEHQWIDSNGVARYFVTRIVPLIGASSNVEGIITISTDISDKERRARDLHNEGISLRRADDRKNEYLATLAHELRGPLAPISSAVQLMKLSNNPATTLKAREIIERQVSQMAGLIDDLMEVGRITTGKLKVSLVRTAIDALINNVVESTQPVFSAKRQKLERVEISPNLMIKGDQVRLTQLLTNLLVNASKYSSIDSKIILEVVKVDSDVEFRVQDEGIGLTEQSAGEIFDMFAQVHSTGKDARGGLGIGLALAQQVAMLHGGVITVISPGLGLGSTFIFKMPLLLQYSGDSITKKDISVINNTPMNLLVVDDNEDGADMLADMIRALGHTATTVYNGTEAILLLENESFDLAFLDLGLPDKTGVEVALTVFKKTLNDKVRLIALTGLGRDQDRYMTKAAGFEEHLVKPIKFADLLRLIGEVDIHAKTLNPPI